jgi:nucleotide-binding universal stress UspA family protein
VLTRARQPVLIAQSDAPWRSIILATDGSTAARAAEAFLPRLNLADATIHVVTAAFPTLGWEAQADMGEATDAQIAVNIADAAMERLRRAGLPVGHQYVFPGRIPDLLIGAADALDADVIVMGTHGTTGWRRKVLGSVSGKVARISPVSVLITPPENIAGSSADTS